MKKYISPKMSVVELQNTTIIATSNSFGIDSTKPADVQFKGGNDVVNDWDDNVEEF